MKTFEIVSDSSCDLPKDYVVQNDISVVPFSISFDSKNYLKEGIDIDSETFYQRIANGETSVKTSLPSIQDYLDAFTPILEKGKDIVCICLSSKFSGSYQSAVNAATILEDEYTESKIVIIDSQNATAGQGYIVKKALEYKENNKVIDGIEEFLQKYIENSVIYFTIDTLDFLSRGGRIGKGAALSGTLLDIKPILYLKNGELGPHSKIRRRKKAIASLLEILDNELRKINGQYDIEIITSVINQEAIDFKNEIVSKYCTKDIPMSQIGLTIGVHCGPTAIGFLIVNK